MSRYIDADAFGRDMYYETFEKDTDMQKWDSGCWIRYKLFENVLEQQPTADVVEVVRCKDCIFNDSIEDLENDISLYYYCTKINDEVELDDYCSFGERREDDIQRI